MALAISFKSTFLAHSFLSKATWSTVVPTSPRSLTATTNISPSTRRTSSKDGGEMPSRHITTAAQREAVRSLMERAALSCAIYNGPIKGDLVIHDSVVQSHRNRPSPLWWLLRDRRRFPRPRASTSLATASVRRWDCPVGRTYSTPSVTRPSRSVSPFRTSRGSARPSAATDRRPTCALRRRPTRAPYHAADWRDHPTRYRPPRAPCRGDRAWPVTRRRHCDHQARACQYRMGHSLMQAFVYCPPWSRCYLGHP